MASFHIIYEFAVAILAAVISVGAGKLFLSIREDKQSVLTKFKLKPDQTYYDFVLFYIGEFLLLVTFIVYTISGLTEQITFLSYARLALVIFLTIIAYTVLRMWVRSK